MEFFAPLQFLQEVLNQLTSRVYTDEEMKHFKRRYEEGYDVPSGTHYI